MRPASVRGIGAEVLPAPKGLMGTPDERSLDTFGSKFDCRASVGPCRNWGVRVSGVECAPGRSAHQQTRMGVTETSGPSTTDWRRTTVRVILKQSEAMLH